MTTYLVRHGSAGSRDGTDPHDTERSLDPDGLTQAVKLSDWLSHEPITHLLSSPLLRCVQSLEPLSRALDLPITTADALTEGTAVESAWALLASVAPERAVLCSHGDVIPDLIRRAQLRGLHIPSKSGCAKGSVWTLQHWDGERFATGIYTPIPRG